MRLSNAHGIRPDGSEITERKLSLLSRLKTIKEREREREREREKEKMKKNYNRKSHKTELF